MYFLYYIRIPLVREQMDLPLAHILDILRLHIFQNRNIHIVSQKLGAEYRIPENRLTGAVAVACVISPLPLFPSFFFCHPQSLFLSGTAQRQTSSSGNCKTTFRNIPAK